MSRFVAAGAADEPTTAQDEAWLEAQTRIDATRLQKKAQLSQQDGGQSLYETLQANKGDSMQIRYREGVVS